MVNVSRLLKTVRNEDGSTLPMFSFALLAVVTLTFGAVAMGLDSRAANNLQNTADSAALAGATAFMTTPSPRAGDRLTAAKQAATATARGNAEYVMTDLDISAVTEDAYGQHTEIGVALSFEPANTAAKILGRNGNIRLTRTAVASSTRGFPLCVLSLTETGSGLSTADNTTLTARNCVIWSNAAGNRSMNFTGGDATTKYFCAAGQAPVTRGTQISPRPTENCDPIPDPLSDWQAPKPDKRLTLSEASAVSRSPAALLNQLQLVLNDKTLKGAIRDLRVALVTGQPLPDADVQAVADRLASALESGFVRGPAARMLDENGVYVRGPAEGLSVMEVAQILGLVDNLDPGTYADEDYVSGSTLTLEPGTYAGLDIFRGHVKMAPGVYHIVDAPLIVRRKATLSGEGVTIIFHGRSATFSVTDQARLKVTAPVDGETRGFALAEDRQDRIPRGLPPRSRLTGNGTISVIGTIYLPRHKLAITGDGAADQASPLLQIVADSVSMTNNGGLNIRFEPGKTDVPMRILPEREARLLR